MRPIEGSFGPEARDRRGEADSATLSGAIAALETFYFAFNSGRLDVIAAVWSRDPLAQLNNPLGGVVRGGTAISALYRQIFDSSARVSVLFVGREHGEFTSADGRALRLSIRTTRYFVHADGRWSQLHHHGSIADPDTLRAYQEAVSV